MNQLKTEGGRVYVEFCIKCEQHQWCTKHNSAKYLSYFNNCTFQTGKNELLRSRPDLTLYPNTIPPHLSAKFFPRPDNDVLVVPGKLSYPRLGAFEIYYRGQVVFSKLSSGLWPHPAIVSQTLRSVDEEYERKVSEAQQRKSRKRTKSSKKKLPRKKSAKATPFRVSRSPTRPGTARVKQSASEVKINTKKVRPLTAKPRSPIRGKRSGSPERSPPDFHDPPSNIPHKTTNFSSSEDEKQTFDEGIQVDRFELTPRSDPPQALAEEEPLRLSEPERASSPSLNLKVPERPQSAKKQPESSHPIANIPLELPVVTEQHHEEQKESDNEEEQMRRMLPDARYPREEEEKLIRIEGGDEADYGEDQDFENSGEEEAEHPLRAVTKSYPVEIPMGKQINKKITVTNETSAKCVYTLRSSHPKEMEVRDPEIEVESGDKGPLRVMFTPVYEECTKKFYLYVDQNEEPLECFEFVVSFT